MSALEEIEAAIKKLTKMRTRKFEGNFYPHGGARFATSFGDGKRELLADTFDAEATEMFVTLHATIDAQLAILTHAHEHFPHFILRGAEEEEWLGKRPSVRDAFTLATAINGTAS